MMALPEPNPIVRCESYVVAWDIFNPVTKRWRNHGTIKTYVVFTEVGGNRIYLGQTEVRTPKDKVSIRKEKK